MKHIKYIILIFVFCTSCSDEFLTRDHPTGITDENFWKTTNDAVNALNSCYGGLPHGGYHYSAPYVSNVALEGMTDNMYHSGNYLGDVKTIGSGTNNSLNWHPRQMWQSYYEYIRRCSRFLENIETPYFTSEEERDRMIGEAHILRAYYHMLLYFYFGGNEGIPIVDHPLNPEEIFASRASKTETEDFILSELDLAINNPYLPNKYTEDKSWRVSKAVAYSLKAIVGLQAKRYEVAKEAALKVINMQEFDLFYTSDPEQLHYRDLFRYVGQINNERIMYTRRGFSESWFRSMPKSMGGQGASNPTASIVNAYETLEGKTIDEYTDNREEFIKDPNFMARDPRLDASIWLPGEEFLGHTLNPFDQNSDDAISQSGASKTGFALSKFIDPEDVSKTYSGNLDYMIIRYAEILLVYVESLIELGDYNNPDVVIYLNKIRNRAGMPNVDETVYNTQEKLRELLRRERRVELAFEGQRYFDLRRWQIAEQQMEGTLEGAYDPDNESPIVVETRVYSSPKNDYLPIPQAEIDANENMKQNSGW
ncbi:RagB/SusD family nutrient uptake outer membrane protein [Arenibacter aquaticus]|uniref:RagB/SusD family nutrient uptake outer membrane protein n=1 Tax=Arenibacter aquaticus TaxID=2489054 RepID=A0A430K3D3_9FLAO|nr:RagB/SusD family nutrient uptake outer membrane protein [Arenibacter aquaticus]RTE53575.1 RagB/SusD family nutrient uptake outer membrane protein [Arenibacter aquaticus]